MRKLLCKPKDRVATEDKNNIVYETDCSNCEAAYFGESKRSLKSRLDEHKRPVRNCDCDKHEIAKHYWEANHNFNWYYYYIIIIIIIIIITVINI